MTQTIKEHLAAIRSALTCFHSTDSPDYCDCVCTTDALEHFAAIEAKLDAPMKSAEEWVEEINSRLEDNHSREPSRGNRYGITKIIRAIQADAIARKLPEVDLDSLENDVIRAIRVMGNGFAKEAIHAAFLKARGGV